MVRIWFSEPRPDPWEPGLWVDYKSLRSWLRHPWLTFYWWRLGGMV